MTTLGDDFFDRLRVLNNQARRISTSEEEILVYFRRTREAFALAHDTPTVTTRADAPEQYIWTTTPGPTQIVWGEFAWKT